MSSSDDGNPLLEGLRLRRSPDPCAIVIFGATGDLTRRKIFPALYALALRRLLPERFGVVGVARTEQTTKQWIAEMKKAVREHARDDFDAKVWRELADGMRYVATDFAEDEGQDRVVDALRDLDEKRGCAGNRLYYLAVPPAAFETIVNELGERRSTEGWIRLIVEKPFGHDRDSAHRLNEILQQHFTENEIFRIDHYLGKETVQNMLALRFANGIFEPIWNRQFIDHVQITVGESIGIEGRAAFYEQAGVIRDVFQNHLLQLVALTAMEPPIDFTADSVRNEKVKVLRSLHTPGPKSVVRGQYARGFIEGEEVPGYREEPGVAGDSTTETYIAAKLYVDNWRWADTPFYVRAGKRLPRRETTIAIQFQRAPHPPFAEIAGEGLRPNVLLIHVQPDEGVSLAIGAKVPGAGMSIRTVHMDFLYGGAFRTGLPEAYERLILDAMLGDATLFTRADEVDEQWGLVDAIVAAWKRDRPNFPNYPAGTWGPVGRGRSDPPRRPLVAAALMAGVVAQVEKRLAELRVHHAEGTRTSVMTHVAWAPPQWAAAARRTLAGLEELHPSRTILLFPDARKADGIGVDVELKCFTIPGSEREVCSEVIKLRLGGSRTRVPGSIVQPLLITDLPTFCRWRGLPPWGSRELEQLVDVCDRLVVDSSEWRGLPARLREARRRSSTGSPSPTSRGGAASRWRGRLASLWPDVKSVKTPLGDGAEGRRAPARRLAALASEAAGEAVASLGAAQLERVAVDGEPVPPPRGAAPSASDLLSAELDVFGRDPIYEAAVSAAR